MRAGQRTGWRLGAREGREVPWRSRLSPARSSALCLQRHSAVVCSPLGLVSALSGTVGARWQVAVAEQGQDSLLEGSHPSGFIVLWELGQS